MHPLTLVSLLAFFWTTIGIVVASDTVGENRIKVFLFAAPAFFQASEVDAGKDICVSLGNNLIDGKTQSILIGGADVDAVWARKDHWSCTFYDNYNCETGPTRNLTFVDGVNSLGGVGWQTKIHSLKCGVDSD
ncbi:uncharacterized protein BDR25DRAFT_96577 [Lindgomyces ingoldianus]|uniref:Uncharacterized protein n=1 Tax=Lindgomyces ingoldianus TaxID=673940 RepID=A0ACB6QED7_9PLEO|nr:uncharacterized protein BDR25DRAFT_96577 [Lindgomyces ingoldianus]KAF2464482.1 hypothetical protein BDR25DRAFT_96577 [Lindgomyces ingoldianus]